MNKELVAQITQWFKDGDRQMRKELRMYVFSLDLPYGQRCFIWDKVVKSALNSKQWRPKEESKTIVI